MAGLILLEPDDPGPAWAPFAGAAPLADLRAGGWRIADRWSVALGTPAIGVVAPHAAAHGIPAGPPLVSPEAISGPVWVVDATFVPKLPMRTATGAKRLVHGGRAVAWRLDPGERWSGRFEQGDGLVVDGRVLRGAFDLITVLEQLLFADTLLSLEEGGDAIGADAIVLGNPAAVALRNVELEPGVVFDARKGAIVCEDGVRIRAGTRIEGPFWAGPGTWLLGGAMRHVSAGPHCRLHGELSTSVFNGYANKSHDGFIGHSVIGAWVNLGAGTITSNLKNTYGPVRLDVAGTRIETERSNLGSLVGDHVKTAIGTLLPTGAVIGTGANLFGPPRAPKYVAPFSWGGDGDERLEVEAFLTMAHRILPRRDVPVDDAVDAALRAIHRRLAP